MKSRPEAQTRTKKHGFDELNVVEYPLGFIDERAPTIVIDGEKQELKTLTYTDWHQVDGKRQELRWSASGSHEHGLPRGLDHDLLVIVITLAVERGLKDPHIPIQGVWSLLRVLGWHDNGHYYKRFIRSIDRWSGLTIYAQNAWWHRGQQVYLRKETAGIFKYQLTMKRLPSGRMGMSGWIRIEPELWGSIVDGNINEIDLTIYNQLKTQLQRRLYRYLDKKSKGRTKDGERRQSHARDMFKLAETLGVGPKALKNYRKRPIDLRRKLDAASKTIQHAGVIQGYSFRGLSKATIRFQFVAAETETPKRALTRPLPTAGNDRLGWLVEQILAVTGDQHSTRYYYKIARELPQSAIMQDIKTVIAATKRDPQNTNPAKFFTHLVQLRRDPSNPQPADETRGEPVPRVPARDDHAEQTQLEDAWSGVSDSKREALIAEAKNILRTEYPSQTARWTAETLENTALATAKARHWQRQKRNKD